MVTQNTLCRQLNNRIFLPFQHYSLHADKSDVLLPGLILVHSSAMNPLAKKPDFNRASCECGTGFSDYE